MDSRRQPFKYSDGIQAEEKLLKILKAVSDTSTSSDELEQHIDDWPTEYHFSRARHNLLRDLPISSTSSVLEVGCGCGAITRFLAENVNHVTAIDGSRTRLQIAEERCRDLSNIDFICCNIQNYVANKKFDIITLIGVLEYSNIYLTGHSNRITTLLETLANMLSEDGEIIVAIENKTGLKYYAGFPEDHNGLTYYGIHSLYRETNDFVTLGKYELEKCLINNNLFFAKFYYPFPDYKLPRLILTEKGVNSHRYIQYLWQILSAFRSRSYHSHKEDGFEERLAWEAIYRNGMTGFMANSFLVRASRTNKNLADRNEPLLYYYSDPARKAIYHVKMQIRQSGDRSEFDIRRQHVFGGDTSSLHDLVSCRKYIDGPNLHIQLLKATESLDAERFIEALTQWRRYLEKLFNEGTPREHVSLRFFDVNPFNLVYCNGKLTLIDDEWNLEGSLHTGCVFIHYLVQNTDMFSRLFARLPRREALTVSRSIMNMFSTDKDQVEQYVRLNEKLADLAFCGERRPLQSWEVKAALRVVTPYRHPVPTAHIRRLLAKAAWAVRKMKI